MNWLAEHGFDLLQSVGIIGGLAFTGVQLRIDARARRVENRLEITRHHREIWWAFANDPKLSRVLDREVDLENRPITERERLFVNAIILHLNAAFTAYREGMAPIPEGLALDIQNLFSKPIPLHVWAESLRIRDRAFHEFVNQCIEMSS